MPRLAVCALAAAFSVAGATPSWAADPLLSGYSGPGGGEQVILDSQVLPAAGADVPTQGAVPGKRSLKASPQPALAASPSAAPDSPASSPATTATGTGAAAPTASQPASSPEPSRRAQPGKSGQPGRTATETSSSARPNGSAPTSVDSREAVRYPSTVQNASALPLSGGGVLAAIGGIAVLIALTIATARLGSGRLKRT